MDPPPQIIRIEDGDEVDTAETLRLFDDAQAWLAAQGRTGQWGEAPRSTDPAFQTRAEDLYKGATAFHAVHAEGDKKQLVGVLVVAPEPEHPEMLPPPAAPQLYVKLLLTSRDPRWRGLGGRLMDQAKAECRARGIRLLRVDCYGGDDGKLSSAYERMGFVKNPLEPLQQVKDNGEVWPMQVLEMWL